MKKIKKNNICRFCQKNIESDKVRDHCHLTGKNRGPAHSNCDFNGKQKDSILFHLYFTILVIMIAICSLRG